jgi:hypothetical protein
MVSESWRIDMASTLSGFGLHAKANQACAASQSRTFSALSDSGRFFGQAT